MSDLTPTTATTTTAPQHPLATTNQGKSGAKKKPATTGKLKKTRKLSDEQLAECVSRLISTANVENYPDKMLSVSSLTKALNVSVHILERVFIRSKLGRDGYDLDYDVMVKTNDNTCFIDKRSMLMIAKRIFEGFNKDLPDDEKFEPGQEFTVAHDGDNIILTRIS